MADPLDAVAFGRSPLPTVLFDANVLFQAAATRFLLGGARSGLFRPLWTIEIVDEARRNLTEAGRLGGLAALEQNLQLIRDALGNSASTRQANALTGTDKGDRHVLAAAIKHSVAVLVTDNVRDFGAAEASAADVAIVTVRSLATHLAGTHAGAMARFIEREPPERFERFVASLRRQFPEAIESLGL